MLAWTKKKDKKPYKAIEKYWCASDVKDVFLMNTAEVPMLIQNSPTFFFLKKKKEYFFGQFFCVWK